MLRAGSGRRSVDRARHFRPWRHVCRAGSACACAQATLACGRAHGAVYRHEPCRWVVASACWRYACACQSSCACRADAGVARACRRLSARGPVSRGWLGAVCGQLDNRDGRGDFGVPLRRAVGGAAVADWRADLFGCDLSLDRADADGQQHRSLCGDLGWAACPMRAGARRLQPSRASGGERRACRRGDRRLDCLGAGARERRGDRRPLDTRRLLRPARTFPRRSRRLARASRGALYALTLGGGVSGAALSARTRLGAPARHEVRPAVLRRHTHRCCLPRLAEESGCQLRRSARCAPGWVQRRRGGADPQRPSLLARSVLQQALARVQGDRSHADRLSAGRADWAGSRLVHAAFCHVRDFARAAALHALLDVRGTVTDV